MIVGSEVDGIGPGIERNSHFPCLERAPRDMECLGSVAEADFVEPVAGEMRRGSNRPAQLYRLREARAAVLFDRTI